MTNRRSPLHLPYFFEVFTLANLLLIHWMLRRITWGVVGSLPVTLRGAAQSYVLHLGAGAAIRAVFLYFRGGLKNYFRIMASPAWIIDSVRVILFGTLVVHTYCWIKLMVPVLHPTLYDAQLWEIDRHIFFGMSPNIFFLNIFSAPLVLRALDWSYSYIFLGAMAIAFAFFLSEPSRRLRTAFMNANAVLWITGAWLYMLVPSIGPAYRFPDVWMAVAPLLKHTNQLQVLLMHNYQLVVRDSMATDQPINVVLGIAAFPSLHVGFITFGLLWVRKLWRPGAIIFAVFTLLIFIGSVVTGWHYLIDSIAGVALAFVAFLPFNYYYRINRWIHLRQHVPPAQQG